VGVTVGEITGVVGVGVTLSGVQTYDELLRDWMAVK
jgi:hypothetical protein